VNTATLHSDIEIDRDHPSFAGHFPQFPVLPGALLLDEALQAIQLARGIDLGQWHIAAVKFLDAVKPGDLVRLEHSASSERQIRFSLRVAERMVCSGSLARAASSQGAP
jgi:3-hydroxyacyl-[acyl-carrier-protein] dehydratase